MRSKIDVRKSTSSNALRQKYSAVSMYCALFNNGPNMVFISPMAMILYVVYTPLALLSHMASETSLTL